MAVAAAAAIAITALPAAANEDTPLPWPKAKTSQVASIQTSDFVPVGKVGTFVTRVSMPTLTEKQRLLCRLTAQLEIPATAQSVGPTTLTMTVHGQACQQVILQRKPDGSYVASNLTLVTGHRSNEFRGSASLDLLNFAQRADYPDDSAVSIAVDNAPDGMQVKVSRTSGLYVSEASEEELSISVNGIHTNRLTGTQFLKVGLTHAGTWPEMPTSVSTRITGVGDAKPIDSRSSASQGSRSEVQIPVDLAPGDYEVAASVVGTYNDPDTRARIRVQPPNHLALLGAASCVIAGLFILWRRRRLAAEQRKRQRVADFSLVGVLVVATLLMGYTFAVQTTTAVSLISKEIDPTGDFRASLDDHPKGSIVATLRTVSEAGEMGCVYHFSRPDRRKNFTPVELTSVGTRPCARKVVSLQ